MTWNVACSYGAHIWVRGPAIRGLYFQRCAVCEAQYQCSANTWTSLPEQGPKAES